jgi:nitrogen fixation-related uncharacterized protein
MRLMRLLVGLGGFMLIVAPTTAFAHDNLGDDELAVANWMLVAAMVTVVIGVLAGLWAASSGQFTNIEESKFSMLDTADDYDKIMAEADERERLAKAARSSDKPAVLPIPEPAVAASKQKQAHI